MEGEEGGVSNNRLKKLAGSKSVTGSGEVDYKTKSGTAWSHSYLNQKPWHPLSYPNQRRKWIAEQIHSERDRRAEEIAREVKLYLFQLHHFTLSVSAYQFRCLLHFLVIRFPFFLVL